MAPDGNCNAWEYFIVIAKDPEPKEEVYYPPDIPSLWKFQLRKMNRQSHKADYRKMIVKARAWNAKARYRKPPRKNNR